MDTRSTSTSSENDASAPGALQYLCARPPCAHFGDQVPAWDGDTGLYMGERKGGGPGNVVQIVIAPRVGTNSYSLNAAEGTLLSAALVGPTKEEARQRLLYTAGEVVSNGSYAVTPRRLSAERSRPCAASGRSSSPGTNRSSCRKGRRRGSPSRRRHRSSRDADRGFCTGRSDRYRRRSRSRQW